MTLEIVSFAAGAILLAIAGYLTLRMTRLAQEAPPMRTRESETARAYSAATKLVLLIFALFAVVHYGLLDRAVALLGGVLPPAQVTVAPAAPRPFSAPPAQAAPAQAAPAEWHPPLAVPTAQPQAQPAHSEVAPAAPAEAAPAGAPMTEEYQQTIQQQQRTNAAGEVCLPRSGCTKPGSGGALPWKDGRP